MSYSFTLRAASKELAQQAIAKKMSQVAVTQTCHDRDRDRVQAVNAACSLFDCVDEPNDQQDYTVNMSGYLSGNWVGPDMNTCTGVQLTVSINLVQKLPEPQ